jgi:hypothetical protein
MDNPSDLAFTAYPGDPVACPEKVYAYIQSLEAKVQKLEARIVTLEARTNPIGQRYVSPYDAGRHRFL